MSLPKFPDLMFVNSIQVILDDDFVNKEGGANPVANAPVVIDATSVQPESTHWEGDPQSGAAVTVYLVKFQTDPTLVLNRPIRNGDHLVFNGLDLIATGPVTAPGGYDWIWHVRANHVKT